MRFAHGTTARMSNLKRSRVWLFLAFVVTIMAMACLATIGAHAQSIPGSSAEALTIDASDSSGSAAGTAEAVATNLIVNFAKSHPWIATLVFILGALRAIFKPIMGVVENYVKQRCTPEQYGAFVHFESSWIFKAICWLLDFGASIKLPSVGAAAQVQGQPKVVRNGN
jgi:hypothetical protein